MLWPSSSRTGKTSFTNSSRRPNLAAKYNLIRHLFVSMKFVVMPTQAFPLALDFVVHPFGDDHMGIRSAFGAGHASPAALPLLLDGH
jgi:hypothetical protein